MQDAYVAVREEVEQSVATVTDLHKKWLELSKSADKRSDEVEWTSSELLSGLRSIEWDLQDLEDTVSIVEGNRAKFQLEESDVQARKDFIELTRKQIVAIRDEVQEHAQQSASGFSTKTPSKPGLPSIGKASKGYGKVGVADDTFPAVDDDIIDDDMERGHASHSAARSSNGAAATSGGASDEILAAEIESDPSAPAHGRHRKKKACLAMVAMLLVGGGIAAAALSGGGSAADAAAHSNANATANDESVHEGARRMLSTSLLHTAQRATWT